LAAVTWTAEYCILGSSNGNVFLWHITYFLQYTAHYKHIYSDKHISLCLQTGQEHARSQIYPVPFPEPQEKLRYPTYVLTPNLLRMKERLFVWLKFKPKDQKNQRGTKLMIFITGLGITSGVLFLQNRKSFNMLTTTQKKTYAMLGEDRCFWAIEQDKFKLTFIN
jgi:hypothetical protein